MIDLETIRREITEHKIACASMPACCAVGDGEIAEQLLAEVDRLKESLTRVIDRADRLSYIAYPSSPSGE